ncbi:MAG: glycosyltransferase [Azoarcus sp.]|jgi:hypothetical protein|nr:glycosyltransferase [Azoarcus sp.]
MKIGVVIPMLDEAAHIGRTLDAVRAAATFAGIECETVAVDDGSSDGSPEIAMRHGARVLVHPGMTLGALRNRGAAATSAEWLAFVDADIEVPPDWLAFWRQARQEDRADVLALECDTPAEAPWFARVWHRRAHAGDAGRERRRAWVSTQNLCMERDWFARAGGFDERLVTGEDKDFCLRLRAAGARLVSTAHPAAVDWGYARSWPEWLGKERWRQGGQPYLFDGGAQTRLLRFPLLCLAVALASVAALLALASARPALAAALLLPGVATALVLALRQSLRRREPLFTAQLWLLHWLRLHAGASGLLANLFHLTPRRPARG